MALFLSVKEIWRNRGRFFLFSLVIALITTLVLFIAALAGGLSNANKEYVSKLDAQLIAFQSKVQLSSSASQIPRSALNNMLRVEGVQDLGAIGLSAAQIVDPKTGEDLDISIIGVEPGKPGLPPTMTGNSLTISRENSAVVDANFVEKTGLGLGDTFQIKSLQGKDYQFYTVKIIGTTNGQEYLYAPSVFLPYLTWDQVKPQGAVRASQSQDFFTNIVAVKVAPGYDIQDVAARLQSQVDSIEVVDLNTAIRAIPGYLVQQQTLNTQQGFTLLIGVLVIGGFFQIQMLQKIPLIGVLKAIGTSNFTVAVAVVSQIIMISTFGVLMGGLITFLLSLGIPSTVPIVFSGNSVTLALVALLLIGPLGGLVTVRVAVAVEPLTALGLSS